jgi:hypothetical protein
VVITTLAVVPDGTTPSVIKHHAPMFVLIPLVLDAKSEQATPATVTVGSDPPPDAQLNILGLTQTITFLTIEAEPIECALNV